MRDDGAVLEPGSSSAHPEEPAVRELLKISLNSAVQLHHVARARIAAAAISTACTAAALSFSFASTSAAACKEGGTDEGGCALAADAACAVHEHAAAPQAVDVGPDLRGDRRASQRQSAQSAAACAFAPSHSRRLPQGECREAREKRNGRASVGSARPCREVGELPGHRVERLDTRRGAPRGRPTTITSVGSSAHDESS